MENLSRRNILSWSVAYFLSKLCFPREKNLRHCNTIQFLRKSWSNSFVPFASYDVSSRHSKYLIWIFQFIVSLRFKFHVLSIWNFPHFLLKWLKSPSRRFISRILEIFIPILPVFTASDYQLSIVYQK